MLLSSVTLVLQETLEAALLVSVLLTISHQQQNKSRWLLFGICGGMVLSFLYAGYMVEISEWFDYVGQEIVNATLQILTTLLIVVCTWAAFKKRFANIFIFCAASAVALAITREGSEILLYLNGFYQQKEYFHIVMIGGAIGFSIGLSIGILFYYGLLSLPGKWRLGAPIILMALFAGNMLSQAAQQLTQADWISSIGTTWDSSPWLPENSIIGQLLYALVGYEASPSVAQLIAYLIGVILVLVVGVPRRRLFLGVLLLWSGQSLEAGTVIDKIYHPYVQPLEQELEWRTIYQDEQPSVADNTWVYQLAYGRSLNDRWFAEVYLVGEKSDDQDFDIEAYELEAKWQLTEQGEFWADWGILFELEKEANEDAWEFATAVLVEKEWGKWSGTTNFWVLNKWGSDTKNELNARLNLQARYRYSKAFEPAIEFYSGPDTRGLGPALLGQVKLGNRQRLSWEIGAIFGLDSKSPNRTLRFLLEFEF
jgi:hypothetical protein